MSEALQPPRAESGLEGLLAESAYHWRTYSWDGRKVISRAG